MTWHSYGPRMSACYAFWPLMSAKLSRPFGRFVGESELVDVVRMASASYCKAPIIGDLRTKGLKPPGNYILGREKGLAVAGVGDEQLSKE